jgi:hypothetical protein
MSHTDIIRTNLEIEDYDNFHDYIIKSGIEYSSSLDFYCPKCKQPAMIIFVAGPSGYWGEYFVKIQKVLTKK